MSYTAGHIKHNPSLNLVALRTIFDEDVLIGNQAWLVGTINQGAVFMKTSEVEEWADLYVPE